MTRSANRLLAVILCFAFYGCTLKDDTPPANGFSDNGTLIYTNYAVKKNWTGGTVIAFTDPIPSAGFTGRVNSVQFLLNALRQNGSYTYIPSDSTAFDKTKNFDIAIMYKNVEYKDGVEVANSGEAYSKPTAGTLKFYPGTGAGAQTFEYTLEFGKEHVVSGFYNGRITSIE
ncbi:hypothetical protein [Chitinophaga pinensis]|uniref:DUF5025 domain-containing protein n=1 Tax=Chitinophaga pinensis TaxID=79329 RepID=A0A5C6LQS0_9BACT|nr:hypothetical protein [Chitinophaga pinensis]TWV98957.1 hypothetical protein FEF09_18925 [Chitinophaga pinensis]